MNDTVNRLMGMIEDYGLICKLGLNQAEPRQALEAELVRLFTPLSDEQIHNADPMPHCMFDSQRIEFARAIEAAHGITGGAE